MKLRVLFFIFFLSACSSPYHEHFFRENPQISNSQQSISGEVFYSSGQILSLPNSKIHNEIITKINSASKRIWIEVYTWTDAAKLIEPILNASKRGVDVRVVLEGNVFGTPKINSPIFQKLKNANIPVEYSDNHRYVFTHAKFWIIDDVYFVSTGNWTASFFSKNREYIYMDNDMVTLHFLEKIFLSDFAHLGFKNPNEIPSHMILSPIDSRSKLTEFIQSTQKNIVFYVQTLDDEKIIQEIINLQDKGIEIMICTADNETNLENKKQYPKLQWKLIRKPYLHAKIIIKDGNWIFLGSHNLTNNAIENNREIGIFLSERKDLVKLLLNDFYADKCH